MSCFIQMTVAPQAVSAVEHGRVVEVVQPEFEAQLLQPSLDQEIARLARSELSHDECRSGRAARLCHQCHGPSQIVHLALVRTL